VNVKSGPLAEHLALFVLLVLIVSVVYNGLRRENVREIVRTGLRRGLVFALVSLFVFGFGGYLLAQWLQ
jgi:hypothetical protein